MNIDEIRANAKVFAARLVPKAEDVEDPQKEKEELLARKAEIEKELVRMRARRYQGMDDDRAEDIVEELYRDLLEVEKQLANLDK